MTAGTRVTLSAIEAMLTEALAEIERGGHDAITIRLVTENDGEIDETFSLQTEQERMTALLAIRMLLGQIH